MSVVTEYHFSTLEWEQIGTPVFRLIAKNVSGYGVYIAMTDHNYAPDIPDTDATAIGGMHGEYVQAAGKYLWAKATHKSAWLRIREYGTVDPEEDLASISSFADSLSERLTAHENDKNDPHDTTKVQVGLGNIPNETTSSPLPSGQTAHTDAALVQLGYYKVLEALVNAHIRATTGNVHNVTKNEVGLGKVPNANWATDDQAVDSTCVTAFMNPAQTFKAIQVHTEVAYSLIPQCVIAGTLGTRPAGWGYEWCDSPTELFSIGAGAAGTKTCIVKKGLQVSYASSHKSRLSNVLQNNLSVTIPTDIVSKWYVYVDIDKTMNIASAGITSVPPVVGMRKEANAADTFIPSQCLMVDPSGKALNRVYIGKLIMNTDGTVAKMVSCPIGYVHYLPIDVSIPKNTRYVLYSPFLEDLQITAEVKYQDTFGPTMWNDQIGVTAHPYPLDPRDQIVIQTGLMGILACGQESGSPFGLTFPTVNSALPIRLKLKKLFIGN